MRKEIFILLVVLGLSLGSFACGAASEVGKPAAKSTASNPWGSFKVGSYVTLKSTVSMQVMGKAMDTTSQTKMTLAELTADKAIIDVEATVMGNTSKSRMEVPLTGTAPGMPAANNGTPTGQVKTGTDTVTVAGKSLDCKTIEFESDAGGNKVNAKTWTSDQVPGGVVKSVSTSTGTANTTTTVEAVEYKAN